MKQKSKTLSAVCLFVLFFGFAGVSKAAEDVTFALTESNYFPDGYDNYGTVVLSESDCEGNVGVTITVTPNHEFFYEGSNFGIAAFSLNIAGDPDKITFNVPDGWLEIKLEGKNRSEFGLYVVNFNLTNSRQDPLVIQACSDDENNPDLAIGDFIVPNKDCYLFATHIAGFYLGTQPGLYSFQTSEEPITSAWFSAKCKATAAEEITFTAAAGAGAATLRWTAVSEQAVLGYDIYRARGIFGSFEKINAHLVYATGSESTTAEYEYVDSGLQAGLYAYKLMEIGADGAAKSYGPVRVFVK